MREMGLALATACMMAFSVIHAEESARLQETVAVGGQVRVDMHLVLRGNIKLDAREETVAGQAKLVFPEKVLAVDDNGLASRIARFYEDARAKFVVGNAEDPRQLRPTMRLAFGDSVSGKLTLWSPSGPLNSDEVELIEDVLDTTQLPALLPSNEVKAGDTWQPVEAAQSRLCDLDSIIATTMRCKLDDLTVSVAKISVTGKLHGLAFGSEVKCNVEASIEFDRSTNLVSKVAWKQIDSRQPSPVSPAGAYEVTINVTRSPGSSNSLSESALDSFDSTGSDTAKLLVFEDPNQRYRFYYDRNWHLTMQERNNVIFRRLTGTEMVAQLNVTVVGENANIAEVTSDQLQAMMVQGSDLKISEIIKSEEIPAGGDFRLRLVTAKGSKGTIELIQRHFLARNPGGRQLLFTFLTEPKLEDKIGDADIAVVQSLEFPSQTASNGERTPK